MQSQYTMTNSHILQWHPGFQAALRIELESASASMQFLKEYNLTEKPLQIDTLIIKTDPKRKIGKSIGWLFCRYNVVEYKSPEDYISINDFFRVMGYAAIFQSNTEKVAEIPPDEVTVTFASNRYPYKLIKYLQKTYSIKIVAKAPGVFHIFGLLFPVQLIQLTKLDTKEYPWLSRLRSDLSQEDVIYLSSTYADKRKHPLYDAVMNLLVKANHKKYEEVKSGAMCDALKELFADELEQLDQLKNELAETKSQLAEQEKQFAEQEKQFAEQEKKKAEQEKQQLLIETCQEFGLPREDIVSKIMQRFSKERADAEQVVSRYWGALV